MLTAVTPHQVGVIIRNAIAFNAQNWETPPMADTSLFQSVENLFTLLQERQIDYVLVGGIALLQYVAGRNTEDIDLIMALSSLAALPEIELIDQNNQFVRGQLGALQIDILLAETPLFAKIQQQYTHSHRLNKQTIVTATVEGLILLKLYALPSLYRQGNFAKVGIYENDVATLLQAYQPDMHALLQELDQYVSQSDLQEIKMIVDELGQRLARFRRAINKDE